MTYRELYGDARVLSPLEDADAGLFRGTFLAEAGVPAQITICGLGYFILYINGKRVGNDEFVPPVSDYHDRPDMYLSYPLHDVWNHRIYSMQYDITPYLADGENVIGVMVGGGQYHQTKRFGEGNVSYGKIKLFYRICQGDREILSDNSVQFKRGFFRSANLYHGEVHDYTGFDRMWNTADASAEGWEKPRVVVPPKSEYYIADCPTDKEQELLTPVRVKDFGTYTVYALPRNITGYPVIRCEKPGETVFLECAEELHADGTLDNTSVGYGHQRQTATFVTDNGQLFHPIFCWYGFRYFTLTNNAVPDHVRVIFTDVTCTSDFECSNENLNWYYKAFINSQQGNMHGSIPSDCPHRERLGYTGDGQLTCDAVMTMFDAAAFYRKWLQDIWDCQDPFTGHVQHTAPFSGGGGGPAGWGGAIIVVPYMYYKHYADRSLLSEFYPRMELFAQYMESRCEDGLVVREEKDGWCLGDWCAPEKVRLPEPFVNTSLFIRQLRMLCFCGEALGRDVELYRDSIRKHTAALCQAYLCGSSFLAGDQGADAFALDCGIEDDLLLWNIVQRYSSADGFDTGIFGTDILTRVLFSRGYADLAVRLLGGEGDVSFGHMRKHGATTLWEDWDGRSSHNHPMFGAASVTLFRYLLGINQPEKSVGFTQVELRPVFPDALTYAKGFVTLPQGRLFVSWEREGESIHFCAEIPQGTDCVLHLSADTKKLPIGKTELVF